MHAITASELPYPIFERFIRWLYKKSRFTTRCNVINLRYLDKKRVFSIENNQYVPIEDTFFLKNKCAKKHEFGTIILFHTTSIRITISHSMFIQSLFLSAIYAISVLAYWTEMTHHLFIHFY